MSYYKQHIFFCTNQRPDGQKCCNNARAKELYIYAKLQARTLLLRPHELRMSLAGCLGRCMEGPVLVIYPEAVWYTYRLQEDIDEILFLHIQDHCIVDRLLLKNQIK